MPVDHFSKEVIMTLTEYYVHVRNLIDKGHGDKLIVYSSDDEGNTYRDVQYPPMPIAVADIEEHYREEKDVCEVIICIN